MDRNLILICTFLCIFFGNAFSAPKDLVVTSETPETENASASPEESKSGVPKIYEMKVDTNVSNRFATTLVTSKVKNQFKDAKETTFSMILPDKAFISGFIMEIGGKQYKAYVKEKEEAKQVYDEAVNRGQAAAHVSITARDSNRFTVSVNIEPESKAIFYLTYEELLSRQSDQYEIVMNIQPGQPVKDLNCQVNIMESRPLKFVRTPNLRSGNEISKTDKPSLDPNSEIAIDKNNAVVKFNPSITKQKDYAKELKTDEENGLAGQFVVQYDVERDPQGGEVLVNEGYFVHFFAPSDIQPLPKYVIFILDTSGSMSGQRIMQLKEAMNSTLSELKPEDKFNIVEFSYGAKVWNIADKKVGYEIETEDRWGWPTTPEPVKKEKLPLNPPYDATEENVNNAIKIINDFEADGGTNIMAALKTGIELVNKNVIKENQPMIVFLTDGEATMGDTANIISKITELNTKKTPLISLSFGDGADRKFLEQISLNNSGFARHIYESADASLQLEDFYKKISNPLLSNIKFKYVSNVTDLTKTDFPLLFSGSEIVVAGKKETDETPFDEPKVLAHGKSGELTLKPMIKPIPSSLEKHWAYLTLRQILEQRDAAKDKTGPTQQALPIALKYSFVSDITSLVVVKPNDSSTVGTEDASKTGFPGGNRFYSTPLSAGSFGGGGAQFSYSAAIPAPMSPIYHPLGSAGFSGSPAYSKTHFMRYDGGLSPRLRTVHPQLMTLTHSVYAEEDVLPTSTETTPLSFYDSIITRFDWMRPILSKMGILTTPSGPLDIALENGFSESPQCMIKNSTGICQPLNLCTEMDFELTDVNKFIEYSCKVEKYTGVCCIVSYPSSNIPS